MMKVVNETVAMVYETEPKRGTTPQGDVVVLANEGLYKIMMGCARGSYQRAVVDELARSGYVVGYLAQGYQMKGRAKKYLGRYEQSLINLMDRIQENLPGRYHIEKGEVGRCKGFGYWLSDEV